MTRRMPVGFNGSYSGRPQRDGGGGGIYGHQSEIIRCGGMNGHRSETIRCGGMSGHRPENTRCGGSYGPRPYEDRIRFSGYPHGSHGCGGPGITSTEKDRKYAISYAKKDMLFQQALKLVMETDPDKAEELKKEWEKEQAKTRVACIMP